MDKKMSKKCVLVLGPECTGTKMTAEILLDLGFTGRVYDGSIVKSDNMMVRWSVPTGHRDGPYIDVKGKIESIRSMGFDEVYVIVTTREISSVVNSHHRQEIEANGKKVRTYQDIIKKHEHSYKHIILNLFELDVPYVFSSYESMILDKEKHIRGLCDFIGVEYKPIKLEIVDGNKKYE
jgi:hypothetical protein